MTVIKILCFAAVLSLFGVTVGFRITSVQCSNPQPRQIPMMSTTEAECDVIIIGSGVAGLSCGALLADQGYDGTNPDFSSSISDLSRH